MQEHLLRTVLMMIILTIGLVSSTTSWIPTSKVRTELPLIFTAIYYPESAIVLQPKRGHYMIYQPTMLSSYVEYCTMWQDQMELNGISSCTNYFCTNTFAETFVYNRTQIALHVAMHNYCTYCMVDDQVEYEIAERIQFRRLVQKGGCPHYQVMDRRHCGENSDGYVMLYEPLYNKSQSPYICYCPSLDRYGYRCDVYTAFLIGKSS